MEGKRTKICYLNGRQEIPIFPTSRNSLKFYYGIDGGYMNVTFSIERIINGFLVDGEKIYKH